jgi:hypothetical protein
VIRASLDVTGKLDIGAPNHVVRFQTGNLPSGVTVSKSDGGTRAYANNEAKYSVTAMDLETNTVLFRDISSSGPPAPETWRTPFCGQGRFLHGPRYP